MNNDVNANDYDNTRRGGQSPIRRSTTRSVNRGVQNDLSGHVVGAVIQTKSIRNVTLNSPGAPSGEESNEPRPDGKPAAGFGLFVVIVGFLIYLSQGDGGNVGTTPFPVELGTRPTNSSNESVLEAVGKKLASCASEVVLTPANCPQGIKSPYPAHGVRWTLLGNPMDGAQVVWNSGKFSVRGNAVMTVDYTTVNGAEFAAQALHFQTEFPWQDQNTTIDNVYRIEDALAGKIKKQRPELSSPDVLAVVRDGFARCSATASAPMPDGCPTTNNTPTVKDVTWTFEGDPPPNANARQDFDEEFGLVHVIGSYSATLRRRDAIDSVQPYYSQSGTYDATVIKHEGRLRLLQITHK
jgi:hypothetical protein